MASDILSVMVTKLREISRQAARKEIGQTAERILIEQGYEGATVEAITTAVGISQRTFFRYFATKDEAILIGYEILGEGLMERLRTAAVAEPWAALGEMFQFAIERHIDSRQRKRILTVQAIIETHPSLAGAYLKRLDTIQSELTVVLHERTPTLSWIQARVLVGAAFACFQTATATDAKEDGTALEAVLPETMRDLAHQLRTEYKQS